ncbi:uncharacterized protein BDW43DRAFT_213947 [Aspergillus alliaceus]|uniref:uncharacterized protein n=1 Tax=Petromyces alliaceus TaxID=209559 RepID=UPI0012A4D8DA|nr:uncharacterized protein BDW43DRAFT_213947 [Aspergillus alliaceus]KAB8228569.1 hypothetical protein BDW43DRAFT_213947 [Aspergillus alliaceus]
MLTPHHPFFIFIFIFIFLGSQPSRNERSKHVPRRTPRSCIVIPLALHPLPIWGNSFSDGDTDESRCWTRRIFGSVRPLRSGAHCAVALRRDK